jgi:hypothetical protein
MAVVTTNSLVKNFLDLMGSYWNYNIPLTTQWALAIVPDDYDRRGARTLFSIIKKYTQVDADKFYIPASLQDRLLDGTVQPKLDGLGLYFAQSVKIPKESFSVNGAGIDTMGGYLKGFVGGDRYSMAERALTIDFLDTNLDFVDGLIKPWIIAAAYKGLINTGTSDSIKCTITIQEMSRQKDERNLKPIRKQHFFKGCVPIETSDKSLKYDTEPSEAPVTTVTWAFENYTYQLDPSYSTR